MAWKPFTRSQERGFILWGMALEPVSGFDSGGAFFRAAKAANCVGMFVGHQHEIAMSLYYEGIRLTYGLKTGVEAYHNPALIGTTKITISQEDNSFDVEYVFSDIEYPLSDGKMPQSP